MGEHWRRHDPVAVPRALGNAIASLVAPASSKLPRAYGYAPMEELSRQGLRPAMVPTTRLRAGSDGGEVGASLESAEARLGGAGWGGTVDASRRAWGARLDLAGGNRLLGRAWGQQRYTLTAQAPWGQRASLLHELRWLSSEGQSA